MSLPNAYLTSFKNAPAILKAIQAAQAPPRFTQKFLEGLGYSNTNDRAVINVLKALRFLDESGVPTARYHRFLDQTQSSLVLAEGLRDAYEDLFRINRNAHQMSLPDLKGKMKTLSEGAFTERVLQQMAGTFATLAKEADFSASPAGDEQNGSGAPSGADDAMPAPPPMRASSSSAPPFASLAYNINIQLPESRDPAVYNAIFRALREHFQ